MKFTVLGATGFVGSHVCRYLRNAGHACYAPVRGKELDSRQNLGYVLYCIGLTSDFRTRPFDTIRAHVCLLADVLERANFESFLYLSSTRVYQGAASGREVESLVIGDIYNSSKLTGEQLCLACKRENVRIVRLSNVFGVDKSSGNFLTSIIGDAIRSGVVELTSSLNSAKDYVWINDAVSVLPEISLFGKESLYNVASGSNTTNRQLTEKLAELTGCSIRAKDEAPSTSFPVIDVSRLMAEFDFEPVSVLDKLEWLVQEYRKANWRQ